MSDTKDILPDSRARVTRGAKSSTYRAMAWWVPVFCANCGVDGGFVPEENMTFAFYLCQYCFETYGTVAGTMAIPDEVFWEQLKQERLAKERKD